jgi:hypothetical protein
LLLQTGDCSVERAWTETCAGDAGDVFDHCVTVLWAAGEAGED